MCQSGAISTTCSSLKVPHPNDYKKSHLYELDANSFRFKELKPKIHTSYLGDTLNELHELDLDFCRSNTTVAGVLPSPVERNITWYLTTLALIPSTLKCESDHACVKSLTSQGGFAVFHKTRLTPGNKY